MQDLNYALQDYSISKALLWGNFHEHAFIKSKKGNWLHRLVHLFIAAAELPPISGQIVSIAEMILVRAQSSKEKSEDPQSMTDEGIALLNLKNAIEAFKLFQKAAFLDFPDAQYHLAVCYEKGVGVPENQELALEWFQRAAEAGHPKAMAFMKSY